MKKFVSTVVLLVLVFSMSSVTFATKRITVMVGGGKINTDVAPIIVDGRTMLPVRAVFEAIGAEVEYINEERKVIATKQDTTVTFVIDSNVMTINGEEKTIDVPAMIKNDRTLVPLRACAEAFQLDVDWNNNTRTVFVKIPVNVPLETISADGEIIVKYTYDSNGNEVYYESNYGDWRKTVYNENNQKTYFEEYEIEIPLFDDSEQKTTRKWEKYSYDNYGNMICYETAYNYSGDRYTYTYDSDGNKTSEISYRFNCFYDKDGNINYANVEFEEKSLYDSNGNEIYHEDADGNWIKYTYDDNGNKIYNESSNGNWKKYIYDNKGQLTYTEDSRGSWEKYTYDADGNIILQENVYGGWEKYTYDDNGNEIFYETSDGIWKKYKYDEKGQKTYWEYSSGLWNKNVYDDKGNIVFQENNEGKWGKYTYDDNNNMIYSEKPNGEWHKYKYNEKGQKTYYENSDGTLEKYEYDNKGNVTYYENAFIWRKYYYDKEGNKTHLEYSNGNTTKYITVMR